MSPVRCLTLERCKERREVVAIGKGASQLEKKVRRENRPRGKKNKMHFKLLTSLQFYFLSLSSPLMNYNRFYKMCLAELV